MRIFSEIEAFLHDKIAHSYAVSGGCIANSMVIDTESDKRYFLKTLQNKPSMFRNEANGLIELLKPNTIRVPKVILSGEKFLLLEHIEQGAKPHDFFKRFGESFAKMHAYTSQSFGFFEDNYIGASPQYNCAKGAEQTSWSDFYIQKRLLPQLKLAEQNGRATSNLTTSLHKLINKVPQILAGSEEAPTLLHGDLWAGNYLCDSNGNAVLIDPAVYYGHREADLAMTKMFGGFSIDFYSSYQKQFPLPNGWEYRENLYLLYHYLNHLNLFGNGYMHNCMQLILSYI